MPRDVKGGQGFFRKSLDQCLGSTDSLDDRQLVSDGYDTVKTGAYHYTTYSPCLDGGDISTSSYTCEQDDECDKAPTSTFNKTVSKDFGP